MSPADPSATAADGPAIVLVDHGSRAEAANLLIEQVAEALRARLPGRRVEAAHMELAQPDLPAAIAACVAGGATQIVVHPYFLAPGRHSREDIPRLVAEAATRHPGVTIRVSEPLGLHPGLLDAVIDRIREACD